jgi:hypothetical protein
METENHWQIVPYGERQIGNRRRARWRRCIRIEHSSIWIRFDVEKAKRKMAAILLAHKGDYRKPVRRRRSRTKRDMLAALDIEQIHELLERKTAELKAAVDALLALQ